MEDQTLDQWDDRPIDPATKRIVLKIVGFHMNMVGMYYVWNKELYLTFIHTFAVLILGTFIAHTIVVKDRLFSKSPEESTNQDYSSCFYFRIFQWGIWMFGSNFSYLVFEAASIFEGLLRPCRNQRELF